MSLEDQKRAPGEPLPPAPTKQDPKLKLESLENDHPQDRFGQVRQSRAVKEALARGVGGVYLESWEVLGSELNSE